MTEEISGNLCGEVCDGVDCKSNVCKQCVAEEEVQKCATRENRKEFLRVLSTLEGAYDLSIATKSPWAQSVHQDRIDIYKDVRDGLIKEWM